MKEKYVTITGFSHYYGLRPFAIGSLICCRKEPDNSYDGEAIRCSLPVIGTVGYLANSVNTVAGGTMSAGRIYDHVKKHFFVRVMFTTFTKVICRIEYGDPQVMEKETQRRMDSSRHADDEDDEENDWP